MKPTLRHFVLVVLFTGSSMAQTPVDSVSHKIGLRFIIDGFRLSGGLGAKMWLSNASALAIGLVGRAEGFTYPNSTSTSRSATLRVDYEYHFHSVNEATLFGVAGPTIGFGESTSDGPSYTNYLKYWQVGMAVGIGVEYWLGDNVSLSAAQSITFYDIFYTNKDQETQILTLSESHAILSFYF